MISFKCEMEREGIIEGENKSGSFFLRSVLHEMFHSVNRTAVAIYNEVKERVV